MTTTGVPLEGDPATEAHPAPSQQLLYAVPFVVVAVAGQLSALLDPTNMAYFWLSAVGLVAAVAVLLFPQRRYSLLVGAAIYVASVAALMVADGGVGNSGLGTLFLLAVVAVALYGNRRDSIIVVALVVGFLFVVTVSEPHTAATTARRLLFLGAIAAVLSFSIHALRARLLAANQRTTQLLHQAEAMNAAARELAVLREPESIAAVSIELASQLASLPGRGAAEASYIQVRHDCLEIVAHHGGDGALSEVGTDVLSDTSAIAVVGRTGEAISEELGSAAGSRPLRATWVPISPGGELHGVLKVVMATSRRSDGCVEELTALGYLMEMALANWDAHEELERQATSEERRRVARDLHDGLAHELAFIASKARRTGAPPEVKEISGAADRALDEARRAITVLSASSPQSFALALSQTAEDLGARLGVPVLVDLDEHVDVDPAVAEQLLRIVREGLTNAAVHGSPHYVTLTLREEGDRCCLVIADDGCGFDPRDVNPTRFGLVSMGERAASFGGTFSVDSAPGRGTRLEVTFH